MYYGIVYHFCFVRFCTKVLNERDAFLWPVFSREKKQSLITRELRKEKRNTIKASGSCELFSEMELFGRTHNFDALRVTQKHC